MNKDDLKSLDDIFGIETPVESEKAEQADDNKKNANAIVEIGIERLQDYKKGNLTERYTDEDWDDLVTSIKENGVIQPAVVRPSHDGQYEIILGHHRRDASILAGRKTLPCVIQEMDDDTAELFFIESNIQKGFDRLPISQKSELIFRRYEALKRQGKRTDLMSEEEKEDADSVNEEFHLCVATIKRYIRLYKLSDNMKKLLDDRIIGIRVGVDLSFLPEKWQDYLYHEIVKRKIKINSSQSRQIKKLEKDGLISEKMIEEVIAPYQDKKGDNEKKVSYKMSDKIFWKYFRKDQKKDEIDQIIETALALYFSKTSD